MGRHRCVSRDGPFFKVGHSANGVLHATREYWGSGLCHEPLQSVEDRHHYTAADLTSITICPECSVVAADPNCAMVKDSRIPPT
jgi:hypothetical protein